MLCAEALSRVAVKVFEEEHLVAKVRVALLSQT
jgi:hypothetical protein